MGMINASFQHWGISSLIQTCVNIFNNHGERTVEQCLKTSLGMPSAPGDLLFLSFLTIASTSSKVGGATSHSYGESLCSKSWGLVVLGWFRRSWKWDLHHSLLWLISVISLPAVSRMDSLEECDCLLLFFNSSNSWRKFPLAAADSILEAVSLQNSFLSLRADLAVSRRRWGNVGALAAFARFVWSERSIVSAEIQSLVRRMWLPSTLIASSLMIELCVVNSVF